MSEAIAGRTVSLKMTKELVEETESFARANNKRLSEYIREAVQEKNERQLAQRIRFLVAKFSDEAEAMNEELDAAVGDDLAQG